MLNEAVDLIGRALIVDFPQIIFIGVLVAISIVGLRRPGKATKLRAELDRLSARIAALETAENQRLLFRVKSGPLVPEYFAETIPVRTDPVKAPVAAA